MKEVVSNPSSIISPPIISTTPTTTPSRPHTTTKANDSIEGYAFCPCNGCNNRTRGFNLILIMELLVVVAIDAGGEGSLLTRKRLLELVYAMYEKDAKKRERNIEGRNHNVCTVIMAMKLKYLSSIAEDVIIKRCSQKLDTSVEKLVVDFEGGWNPEMGNYCRKLVEFCSGKAERPSYYDEEDTTMRLLRFAGECSKGERRKEDNFEYRSGTG
ncbi:hypothetical protein HKD37_15G043787 [Glycine soja]